MEIPSFRGDNVNGFLPTDRRPDPSRLVHGYFHSAATLNYVRSLLTSDFADIRRAEDWDFGFVKNAAHKREFEELTERILDSLDFTRVCGAMDDPAFRSVRFFCSHEGLHLPYEEAMTRPFTGRYAGVGLDAEAAAAKGRAAAGAGGAGSKGKTRAGKWYNTSAHMLWIGDRTRQLDHAHVEYFRGVENPIGIKVGPSSDPAELVQLVRTLWPDPGAQPGRVVLITRLGADQCEALLPPLVLAIKQAGLPVVWCCDPMHGNTHVTESGLKTRSLDAVLKELRVTFDAHEKVGSRLGGVHLEMTGENVTECIGGPEGLTEEDLPHRYTTYCDPRLNYAQAMEVAFLIAQHLQAADGRSRGSPRRRFDLTLSSSDDEGAEE